jgi:DNA-binding transcriptional MerR regulator
MNKQGRTSEFDAGPEHQELFPIREVSRLTGVNPVTLRAWERRYGLIQPTRTDSGHRLYSQADIDDIRSILGWLERGVAVSKVGSILVRCQAQVQQSSDLMDVRLAWQQQILEAVQRFDSASLHRLFDQVFAGHTLDQVFGDIFMPVWHDLAAGQGGYGPRAFGQASAWLFLDQFLRGRVFVRLQLARMARSRTLLLGSDEVGVSVLAPGQPMQELTLICERLKPDALVMFSNQAPTVELSKRLERLVVGLECPLLLAGEVAELAQDSLAGSPVACLGAESSVMRQRLRQFLAGQLDT